MDRIRNEYVRGTAHVGWVGDKVRETKLGWFGHVLRRDAGYVGRRMLNMEPPGGVAKRRFMDAVRDNMQVVGVMEDDAGDRARWRRMICCGDP